MTLQQIKLTLAVIWVLAAVMALAGTAHITSITDRIALGIFGLLPPLAMWFWWHDPSQTMSESIHKVRDSERAPRRPASTD